MASTYVNDDRRLNYPTDLFKEKMDTELMYHQLEAIKNLGNGKILWGGVGSGKSLTVLGYYMQHEIPRHIFVITTAKKRDTLDWEGEAAKFGIGTEEGLTVGGILNVDSWNNMHKYKDVENAFFIFDEQRLVGHGAWVKNFLKITKKNHWILLSATPGDNWMDYAPVFIANGFYKNITEFKYKHVLYEPFRKFPMIRGYLNETKLELLRNEVLVEMPFLKHTVRNLNYLDVVYDSVAVRSAQKTRWNPVTGKPFKDASELFRYVRTVVNSDPSRLEMVKWVLEMHPKLIIFYNFDYELEILRGLRDNFYVYEYNGHVKDPLPTGDNWVYLVQYIAGAEAWETTTTDAMLLYSLTYSFKNFIQVQGRIDRLNTPFTSLYYYILVSDSFIDVGIRSALGEKKNFNEKHWLRENMVEKEPVSVAGVANEVVKMWEK